MMIRRSARRSGRRSLAALLPLLAVGAGGCVPLPTQPPVQTAVQTPVQTPPAQTPAPAPTAAAVAPPAATAETLQALAQLTELKEELKKLRNSVEEMQFDREISERRLQNLFQDLDRRILSLERAQRLLSLQPQQPPLQPQPQPQPQPSSPSDGINPPAEPTDPAAVNPGATDDPATGGTNGNADIVIVGDPDAIVTLEDPPEQPRTVSVQEQQTYDQAVSLLKQSRYQDAIREFRRLADTWPDGLLADDAYYWISEAQYVNREYEAALDGFKTVAARYPDSERVPEALLKIGVIQYDIGAYPEAAEIFRQILARFPAHPVAVSAQTRLRRIETTIQ